MEKIAVQSDQQIRHGFELADRGAYFAAQAEFTAATAPDCPRIGQRRKHDDPQPGLECRIDGHERGPGLHPGRREARGELDLPPIVASHRTPVLKNVPPEQLQAMRALKQYLTFAQQQLALAAGEEVSASMALVALGKMHAALAGKPNPEIAAPEAKAIVFFQAAILVCPRNYMAANDLGVLLAHSGDCTGARRMLEHSVLVCRCSENLSNLSVVYRQVGEQRLAELAAEKAQVAKGRRLPDRERAISRRAARWSGWIPPPWRSRRDSGPIRRPRPASAPARTPSGADNAVREHGRVQIRNLKFEI